MPLLNLMIHLLHQLIQRLQMFAQLTQQSSEQARQTVLRILQYLRQTLANVSNPLRYHDAIFCQQATNLIRLCGALLHEALPAR